MRAVTPSRPPAIVLVVPVHDEGPRLAAFLDALVDAAGAEPAPPTHLLVVDDGSGPSAARAHQQAVEAAAGRLAASGSRHAVSLQVAPANQGKGAAIRLGWEAPVGAAWLGFVDGDGAVPPGEVWRLAAMLRPAAAFDALLSVRVRGGGREVRRTPFRDLQGRIFAGAARWILGLRVRDPQCGLKFFRADRLRPLLPSLQERRWLLDLELVLALTRAGASLAEEPIDWVESGRTKLVAGLDPLRMLLGLFRLRARPALRPAGAPR